jgi:predicted glycosyltransferase
MTASAHPVVFRPVIRRLRDQGHEVAVTARDYAQTLGILKLQGLDYIAVGRHAGASRARKLAALASRTTKLHRWADGRFDLAVAHGSNDLALAAAWAKIPAVNTFDYEFATAQHNIGCRLAELVMTPDAIPPERLRRFGVTDGKLRQYPGLKEEYYLADFEPDPTIL